MLCVYSKATSGMPMPIAVIKRPLTQIQKVFPMSLDISDKHNLQFNRRLSDFESVTIDAGSSFTGNALPQPGDLQSSEVVINVADGKVTQLKINSVK